MRICDLEIADRKLLKFVKSRERNKMLDYELTDKIIQLHDIARCVEQTIGVGQLSEDIQKVADRLHEVLHATL
jgi:hypothetical protein